MDMGKKVSLLLVGVGGYGGTYIDQILRYSDRVRLVGGVETNEIPQETIDSLKEHGTRFYKNMDDFYAENSADLCIICTPIHLHKEHVLCALKHGSNVLCEKPAAGCSADVEEMLGVQTDKFVAVGFQHCFGDNILSLKKDILAGVWGKPKLAKSINFFPRPMWYFETRNKWAGRIKTPDGRMINDSIFSNACAHPMQAMLFLLGNEIDTAAFPKSEEVRLYSANKIETFDTIAMKLETEADVPIFYYASHAVEKNRGYEFEIAFENGTVRYSDDEKILRGTFNSGEVKDYGWCKPHDAKFLKCVRAAAGEKDLITCSLKTALPHVLSVEMAMKHMSEKYVFGENELGTHHRNTSDYIYVPGLYDMFVEAYDQNKLPDMKK